MGLIAPHLPPPRRPGRPRTTDLREVVDALLYLLTTGCQWRLLPKEFPPCSTVQRFFRGWREDGTWRAGRAGSTPARAGSGTP
jgi:transposase